MSQVRRDYHEVLGVPPSTRSGGVLPLAPSGG